MRTFIAFASTAWIAIPLLLLAPQQKAKAQYLQCFDYGWSSQCTGSGGFSSQQYNWSPNYRTININPGYGYGYGRQRSCQTYGNGWMSQTVCN